MISIVNSTELAGLREEADASRALAAELARTKEQLVEAQENLAIGRAVEVSLRQEVSRWMGESSQLRSRLVETTRALEEKAREYVALLSGPKASEMRGRLALQVVETIVRAEKEAGRGDTARIRLWDLLIVQPTCTPQTTLPCPAAPGEDETPPKEAA